MTTPEILDCGHPESEHSSITSGYGIDANGKKHCYDCCAKFERDRMIANGSAMLYLVQSDNIHEWKVTDWPGKLSFRVRAHWTGQHNWGLKVYYVRFFGPDGAIWSGKQIGDNTQICHVKRTKLTDIHA